MTSEVIKGSLHYKDKIFHYIKFDLKGHRSSLKLHLAEFFLVKDILK